MKISFTNNFKTEVYNLLDHPSHSIFALHLLFNNTLMQSKWHNLTARNSAVRPLGSNLLMSCWKKPIKGSF